MFIRTIVCLALCCMLAGKSGAETTPPAADAPEVNGAQVQETYQQLLGEWKSTLKEAHALQVQYRGAKEEEKPALRKQFDDLVVRSKTLEPKLIAAAEKAYSADPKQNAEVAEFLHKLLIFHMSNDNYEQALPLAKTLIDGGADLPRVELLGGIAAFATNDYKLAEKYFQSASKSGALEPPAPDSESGEFYEQMFQTTGMMLQSLQLEELLENLRQYEKLWADEQKIREAEAKADDLPQVKFQTTKGDVVIELLENEAPNTVANIVNLVEKGFYDGVPFHRVIPGFMAQGGDPTGTGTGGPGYTIPCECYEPNYRRHFRGSLSMANTGRRDTGGSQFFLTFVPTPHLNGKHTVFGRIIEGIDVLAKIRRVQPGQSDAADKIVKATVVRKRDHEYKPDTLQAAR